MMDDSLSNCNGHQPQPPVRAKPLTTNAHNDDDVHFVKPTSLPTISRSKMRRSFNEKVELMTDFLFVNILVSGLILYIVSGA